MIRDLCQLQRSWSTYNDAKYGQWKGRRGDYFIIDIEGCHIALSVLVTLKAVSDTAFKISSDDGHHCACWWPRPSAVTVLTDEAITLMTSLSTKYINLFHINPSNAMYNIDISMDIHIEVYNLTAHAHGAWNQVLRTASQSAYGGNRV